MALWRKFTGGLRALFHRRQVEQELDDELQSYLEAEVERRMQAGASRDQAWRAARVQMGSMAAVKDEVRAVGWESLAETFWQDIRYAVRILRKSPAFTAVAIITLALGIGANTAIFSLVNAVMLRLLPVDKPAELVEVQHLGRTDAPAGTFTNPLWEQLRDREDVFSGVFAWSTPRFDLAQGGAARYVAGLFASGDYFRTLGVRPAAGRLLTVADDHRGCPAVAVLSYGFWQDHFGASPSPLGTTLSLDKHPFQIIGVSAPGFSGVQVGSKFDVAVPLCTAALFDARLDKRSWWWLRIIGRVKPGLSAQQLQARLSVLSPQVFAGAIPQNWEKKQQEALLKTSLVTAPAATGFSYLRRDFGEPLKILMTVVGLVLLIACGNIAGLMLARATARGKEIALRKALGASRPRLVRQLLTESVLLSAAGALLGFLFARWGSALLVHYISGTRTTVFLDLSLDARVLGFTAAIALFTGIIFGMLPALRTTRVSLTAAMKGSQAASGEHRSRFRAGRWIVAAQVALSLVLLVAAGVLLRSFAKLVMLDAGFDRSGVLIVNANLKTANVPPDARPATYQAIENRLRALPGVVSASRSLTTPISGFTWNSVIQTDSPHAPSGEQALVFLNFITPGYFATMRTPMLTGRNFSNGDTLTSPRVAIVNQTVARTFFGGASPLGKYLRVEDEPGKLGTPIQIVGMVKDTKYESLREETSPTAFFPITQSPEGDNFELRTTTRPMALVSAVQAAIGEVNKEIPLEFHTLAEQVDDSLLQERLLATLSAFFGGLALLLATTGLYGALSYLVTQRQTEFGIRMALGAPPGLIRRLVLRDLALILIGGIAAGTAVSLASITLLRSMLFGLAPRDAVTLLAAIGALSAVALVAGYLPARRATRVDAMVALRCE